MSEVPVDQIICGDCLKAPFPYFGGKRRVAEIIWRALGDCGHYIEPFCGSCAVLLCRTEWKPERHVETVNDADGLIANVWRSLQACPDEVAKWCDWPVNHADLIARKVVLNREYGSLLEELCRSDSFCDPQMARYYIWAASCWIGHGLVCPGQIPSMSSGIGVHAKGQIPNLSDGCMGVQDRYNTNIYAWFRQLSERLRYVRVVCGDWKRVCGGNWQTKTGRPCGIFFDPPYSAEAGRDNAVYTVESATVAHDVREWCRSRADDPDYRIVLAGYFDEHASLLEDGWTVHRWSTHGGYAKCGNGRGLSNRHKEALFFSPHCLPSVDAGVSGCEARAGQLPLFGGSEVTPGRR